MIWYYATDENECADTSMHPVRVDNITNTDAQTPHDAIDLAIPGHAGQARMAGVI